MVVVKIPQTLEGPTDEYLGRVLSVDSVAALRALPTAYREGVVRTLGYYAANDGGGGPDWKWDTTPDRSCTVDGINLINLTNHGYITGDIVRFYGTLPTNITAGTNYYVQRTDANKFGVVDTQLAAYPEVNRKTLSVVSSGLSVNRGDDGCLLTIPSDNPATGRWKRIWDGNYLSVLWAGAKGDAGPMTSTGATGTIDTVVIQHAIHFSGPGSTLDFHDRRYRISQIKLKYGNTVITGQGAVLVDDMPLNSVGFDSAYTLMEFNAPRKQSNISLSASPTLNEGQDEIVVTSGIAANLTPGDIVEIGSTETEPMGIYGRGSYKLVRAVTGTTVLLDSGLDWTLTPSISTISSYDSARIARNLIVEGLQFELIPDYRHNALFFGNTENVEVRNCKFYGGLGSKLSHTALRYSGFDLRVHDCYIEDFLDVPGLNFGYGVSFSGHNGRVHNNTFLRCKHATTTGGAGYKSTRMHVYANYAWDCHTAPYDVHGNAKWCKIEDNFYLEAGKTNHDGTGGTKFFSSIYLRAPDIECRRNVCVATKDPASTHVIDGIKVMDAAADNVIIEDNQFYYMSSGVHVDISAPYTRVKNLRVTGNQCYRQPVVTTEMAKAGFMQSLEPLHDSEISNNYADVNVTGIYIRGVKNTKITGNKIIYGNTTDTWPRDTGAPLNIVGTTATGILLAANAAETHVGAQITGNTLTVAPAVSGQTTPAHVRIQANHNDLTVVGNQFDNTNLNAGAQVVRYDEATQLTRMPREGNIGDKFPSQVVTAPSQILPFGPVVHLSSAGNITLTSTPTILGGFPGQTVSLINDNSASYIALQDVSALPGSGIGIGTTGTLVLGPGDAGTFVFSTVTNDWRLIASAVVGQTTLLADVGSTASTAFQNVTGLSFPVVANVMYRFQAYVAFTATTSIESKWSISGTSLTRTGYQVTKPPAAGAYPIAPATYMANAFDSAPAISGATPAADGNLAIIEGYVQCSAAGTITIRFAPETATANGIIVKAGSTVRWW